MRGWKDQAEEEDFQLWSQDRDMKFTDVPFGGYADGEAVHCDKVWNDKGVPYCSFIVELK